MLNTITLKDGIERELEYTYGSLKELKKLTGKSVSDVFNTEVSEILSTLILVGLVKQDLELERIESLMLFKESEKYLQAVMSAMSGVMPEADPDVKEIDSKNE